MPGGPTPAVASAHVPARSPDLRMTTMKPLYDVSQGPTEVGFGHSIGKNG
jgi:hypothetical protein